MNITKKNYKNDLLIKSNWKKLIYNIISHPLCINDYFNNHSENYKKSLISL